MAPAHGSPARCCSRIRTKPPRLAGYVGPGRAGPVVTWVGSRTNTSLGFRKGRDDMQTAPAARKYSTRTPPRPRHPFLNAHDTPHDRQVLRRTIAQYDDT